MQKHIKMSRLVLVVKANTSHAHIKQNYNKDYPHIIIQKIQTSIHKEIKGQQNAKYNHETIEKRRQKYKKTHFTIHLM
jgi:hypothetical protein